MGRVNKTRQEYCIGLVCEVLGYPTVEEEKRFDFLRGDPTPRYSLGMMLPVDAYFPDLRLVVEFREGQHYSDDKKYNWWNARRTASGVSRKEQRERYDRRREEVAPKHGLTLLIVQDIELPGPREEDLKVIRHKLEAIGVQGTNK